MILCLTVWALRAVTSTRYWIQFRTLDDHLMLLAMLLSFILIKLGANCNYKELHRTVHHRTEERDQMDHPNNVLFESLLQHAE